MSTEPSGSFIRWQAVTIGQLTYATNLVLGLSVATLGFQISLLVGDRFSLVSWQKCAFGLSLLLLALSVALGIALAINRLRAFRATMAAARARENEESESSVDQYRVLYRKFDARTWPLFWCQIGTFGCGVGLVTVSLLAASSTKLL